MTAAQTAIPLLPSIATLSGRYDAWLCDIWGVLHNGERSHRQAVEASRRFRDQGGVVVLISNSPRPRPGVETQLRDLGVPDEAWDGIITSGDVTRALVVENRAKPLFHLGPERDRGIFEGINVTMAAPEKAALVICSGLYDDTCETPDDYRALLTELAARGLAMVCANPDLKVERGDALVYCAGALAALYEELGGTVIYAGKPYQPIYEAARRLIDEARGETVPRTRILAIGDGLHTDIPGAAEAGLDTLFVASGLHLGAAAGGAEDDMAAAIARLFEPTGLRPVGAQARLSW